MRIKLLFIICLFLTSFLGNAQITLTTVSTSAAWSPQNVTKSGATLTWEATNGVIGTISPVSQSGDDPLFDFSANDGTPILVTATSSDGYSGLSRLDLWNNNGTGSEITDLDVSIATALDRLNTRYNLLTALDVTQNTVLTELVVRGNGQLSSGTLNIDSNPLLTFIHADNTLVSSISLTNNTLLDNVRLYNMQLPSTVLDQIVIDLDSYGLLDGNLEIRNNPGDLTFASFAAYNSLIAKGWAIDVVAPPSGPDTEAPVIGVLSSPSNITSSSMTLDWTAATDNTGVTNYNVYVDGVLNTQVGNVLSYDLPGLAANTTYSIYVTALDAAVNESAASNTVQATTLQGSQGDSFTLTTVSTSAAWSPQRVNKSGAALTWEATNAVIGTISPVSQSGDDPLFDFSANDGTPILVTATTSDGFNGLSRLDLWNNNGTGSEITDLDISNATALDNLNTRYNLLTTLDVSQNTVLTQLNVRGNDQLSSGTLDISNNPLLTRFQADNTQLSSIIITNNTLLDNVILRSSEFSSTVLDQVVIDLDSYGLLDGNLEIRANPGDLTVASLSAYNSLIAKGWSIDVGPPLDSGPQINVLGNGLAIMSSGSAIPENGSDFGETTINNAIATSFTIENTGDEDLIITLITSLSPDFPITVQPSSLTIGANSSETFEVSFDPSTLGSKAGSILIQSNSPTIPFFVINLKGESVEVLSNQIMISQYYQGFSGSDNWIEVTNISGSPILAGTYYLSLFDNTIARAGLIETSIPTQSDAIPALAVGETVLFRNAAASLPSPVNIGSATQVLSNVCSFDGDDLILISTTNDGSSYDSRVDIIGNISSGPGVSPDPWGVNDCYIKGGCSSEIAHKTFDISDWSFILLEDVDNAIANRNVALGTQVVGPTEFDGSSWSNLEPDQSRTAVISTSFTSAANTFIACNLTISNGANVIFDSNGATSNSIVIYGDMIVDGSLIIGDTESLVAYNPTASLGLITKIEKSPSKIDRNDVTYWSSPVEGVQINSIFAGVEQERIFEFKAGQVNPVYAGTNYKYWWIASGAMGKAVGYAAPGASAGVQTLSFSGLPHQGTFILNAFFSGTVDTGTANENFNLIGNPYPAAIDILRILEDNGSINEIALWTSDTSPDPITNEYDDADYVYYSTTGSTTPGVTENIGSGQGFMVRTVTGGGIAFNDSYKLIGRNDQFFKSSNSKKQAPSVEEADKIWLRLRLGTEKSDILIGFMEEATDGYDTYYDALGNLYDDNISLIEKNTKFYSKIGNDKYVIQGLSEFGASKNINLGFDTKKTGWFKMSINKKQGALNDSDIYLVDTYLNVKHDLNKSAYEFQADKEGEFSDRFRLEFVNRNADLGPDKIVDVEKFTVSNQFDTMTVVSGKSVNEIRVYDLLGRMIIQEAPRQASFQLNTANVKIGTVMVIEARLEDGSIINTKSIKY